jgi:hypothetical protein
MAPGEAEVRCGSNSALARYPLHFRFATVSETPRRRRGCLSRANCGSRRSTPSRQADPATPGAIHPTPPVVS